MPKRAENPLEYAQSVVSTALKALDKIKSLARYDELTESHRTKISTALREKLNQVDDALDGGEVPADFSFDE